VLLHFHFFSSVVMSIFSLKSSFLISSPSNALCPRADRPEYVFIGRSNVGKSSLINAICGKHGLAKTSAKPGRTQLINYFTVDITEKLTPEDEEGEQAVASSTESLTHQFIVDLPGYGYAKATRDQRAQWEKMIAGYLQNIETIKQIFVLIDSRHTPQAIDIAFIKKLITYNKPFSLVMTKSDKISQKEAAMHLKMLLAEIVKFTDIVPQYFVTSAEKASSVKKIVEAIVMMTSDA
jgi:GTP-binding protein